MSFLLALAGLQPTRRSRGRGNRSRGKINMRKDGTVKFEEDFDFETANAQFHKDEIDKELQNKLKLKGSLLFSVCYVIIRLLPERHWSINGLKEKKWGEMSAY